MEAVRWGILGVSGHFIKRVVIPLRNSGLINLRAIASRDEKRAKEAAKKYGFEKFYGSYDSLLNDKEVEAVYIPLPNNMHVEWVKKAADAGKHILCEKPLALNAREAEELVEYTDKRGVMLMEAFMYRFHPQWIRARELCDIGEIGSLSATQCFFSYNNRDPNNIRNKKEMGGGAIYDIGCYAVSTARFIFGEEPSRVIALGEIDINFKTDILVSGIMDFNGRQSIFTVGMQMYPEQFVYIYGSGGKIKVNIPFNMYPDVPAKLTVETKIGIRDILTEPADQYGLEFEAFSRALREGKKVSPTPPSDAVNNLKVMDALFRSIESGNWESV